jgi:hypothetical protein
MREQCRLRYEPEPHGQRLEAEESRDFIALIANLLKDKVASRPQGAELHLDPGALNDAVVTGV